MPGVLVTTSARAGTSTTGVPESGRWFVSGRVQRGSTTAPIRVRSLGELELECGPEQTYGSVWKFARTAFAEGLGELYIARVVGASAVAATITLPDRAGTPVNTISATAKSKGAWATGWKVVVAAGSLSGTVTITVQDSSSAVVETFANRADVAAIAAIKSRFITFANLNSATAAPNNLPAVGTYTLASGTDDSPGIAPADYVTALALFTDDLGAGGVSIPGFAPSTVAGSSTIGAGLEAHGAAFGRLAVLAAAPGTTYSSALTEVATFRGTGNEGAMYVWPAIIVTDGVVESTIGADAAYAGWRARVHGPQGRDRALAAAGTVAVAASPIRPEFTVTAAVADALDASGISVLKPVAGVVQSYGYRSLSTDTDRYPTANIADIRNTLRYDLAEVARPFVFQAIDSGGRFGRALKGKLEGRCAAFKKQRGCLYGSVDEKGREIDPGYLVDVDSLNTPQSIAGGVFRVLVYFRPAPLAQLIAIELVYTPLGVSFATAA